MIIVVGIGADGMVGSPSILVFELRRGHSNLRLETAPPCSTIPSPPSGVADAAAARGAGACHRWG